MDIVEIITSVIFKFIEDSFINLNPEITDIAYADIFIGMFWSILLSVIIAHTYRGTHEGVSYSQSFTQTLVLLGVIVSIVMLIVGTDIARAFTLVGALSIVRFRNAIKDTRDVGFIFFAMVVGMSCGTRFYAVAIILTLLTCGLLVFMYLTQFGQKGLTQDILELNFPSEHNFSKVLDPIFSRNLRHFSILGVDSIDEINNRLSFVVTFKKKRTSSSFSRLQGKNGKEISEEINSMSGLLADLQQIKEISDVKVISGSHSTEI